MSEIKAKIQSCLLNKKVILSLIEKPATSLYKSEGDSTLLVGATISIKVPNNEQGVLIDPLTEEEREYLESILKKDLSVYSTKDNFWNTKLASIYMKRKTKDLTDSDVELDLSKPYDYIKYKIALVSNKVANAWEERYNNSEFLLVIKDGESEFVDSVRKVEKEDIVLQYLFKIKASKRKMFNLLRLYGDEKLTIPITYSSSLELMYTTLREICKSAKGINTLYPLVNVDEKELSMRILVADAVSTGLLERRGWEYRLVGGEKIGSSSDEVITYLNDKNNQNVKVRIEQEIEEFYKKHK